MLSHLKGARRVVITGMGCVTPIGIGREAFWAALQNGESGVRRIESFDVSNSPVKIAAQVRDFDWQAQLGPKDRKHVPRTVPLALAAAREALADADLFPQDLPLEQRREIGVILGTGGGGLAFTEQQYDTGTLVQPAKPAFTRFPHQLTAVFQAKSQWSVRVGKAG